MLTLWSSLHLLHFSLVQARNQSFSLKFNNDEHYTYTGFHDGIVFTHIFSCWPGKAHVFTLISELTAFQLNKIIIGSNAKIY